MFLSVHYSSGFSCRTAHLLDIHEALLATLTQATTWVCCRQARGARPEPDLVIANRAAQPRSTACCVLGVALAFLSRLRLLPLCAILRSLPVS